MQPEAHKRIFTRAILTLCDFTLMMRKNVVFPTRVQINLISEQAATHRGTLDVPTGEPFGIPLSGRCPFQHVMRIGSDAEFPEREVGRMLLAFIHLHT